jgi:CDP-diacylglycerol--glycerol-3-phosphate 3-phosphatidyltransferase
MAASGLKGSIRKFVSPLGRFLADLGVPPAAITYTGLVLSAVAGWSLARGHFIGAGLLLILAGICDMIDGAAARAGNTATPVGAFLDSTIDRYSEIVVFLGALFYYLHRSPRGPETATAAVVLIALAGSLMVSYTRARAEAVGEECQVGIAERPERLIILIVGALLGPVVFRVALWVLAILSHVTAFQRIRHVLGKRRA